jgi:hypothetical protein
MNNLREGDVRAQPSAMPGRASRIDMGADGVDLPVDLPVDKADELDWLMSLALDGELDAADAARLDALLEAEATGEARWQAWQALDADLARVPAALPSAEFAPAVARRVAVYERQRRLRAGVLFGLVAVTLWTSALVVVVLLGAFFWANQGALLGGFVHNFAAWWTAVRQVGLGFLQAGESLLATEQTRMAVTLYLGCTALILAGWFVFLRRTLQIVPEYDA